MMATANETKRKALHSTLGKLMCIPFSLLGVEINLKPSIYLFGHLGGLVIARISLTNKNYEPLSLLILHYQLQPWL